MVSCGGVFGDRIFTVPKHTPTTGVQIEKCTVSIWKCGAAGSPAGGQRLPGRLLASCLAGWLVAVLAHQLAGWLLVERINVATG